MKYQELIRLSTKGDQQALEDLFVLAEKHSAEKNYEEASKVFRESAISYRISAFRNSGHAGEANGKAYWLNEEIKLIKHWIEVNLTGLRPVPRIVEGLNKESIFEIVGDEIWPNCNYDGEYYVLMSLLETSLDKIDSGDMPANSPLRRILYLMNTYFGLADITWPNYLDSFDVRIWTDLLADEVGRRFYASQKD